MFGGLGIIFFVLLYGGNIVNAQESLCDDVIDYGIWTSPYQPNNSEEFHSIWKPSNICDNCHMKNVVPEVRFLDLNPTDNEVIGEGYVMISEGDESLCNSPEKMIYNDYLFYESETDTKKISNKKYDSISCYGIKTYASKHHLLDVFKIKYTLCNNG